MAYANLNSNNLSLKIPLVDCIVMARPTRSQVLYQQMIGRGIRLSPGKSSCLLIDFVDNCTKNSPVLFPNLLGLDVTASKVDAGTPLSTLKATTGGSIETSNECKMKITRDQWDLFETPSETERVLFNPRQSRCNWISVHGKRFILNLSEGRFIRVEWHQTGDSFLARLGQMHRFKGGKYIIKWSVIPIKADSLSMHLRACETFAINHLKCSFNFLSRQAAWRRQPASAEQIRYAKHIGAARLTRSDLSKRTKGELELLITLIRHGFCSDSLIE